jgi:hypothetical protein
MLSTQSTIAQIRIRALFFKTRPAKTKSRVDPVRRKTIGKILMQIDHR